MIRSVPGIPNLLLGAYDIGLLGYTAEEFFVSGTATAASGEQADYTTRVVALTPERFNGTVVVEWLNVSGGIDAPAVWFMAHRELARSGFGYVAVSAQLVGVEGGENLVGMDMSLKAQDAERYSLLHHPGDAFAYDMYTQVGRHVRAGEFGLRPDHVLAVGESQSAMFLTTYVNDVDPVAAAYDGFLVHSRFGTGAPLDGTSALESTQPAPFRDDLRAPVLTVITETDLVDGRLLGYHHARRPDGEWLRAWELPGSAHADNYTIKVGFIDSGTAAPADLAAAYAPTDQLMGQQLSYRINFAPQHHYVLQAALAALNRWVRDGVAAPTAPPMSFDGTGLVLDRHGLATGGVRTPWVDVPIARTSGAAPAETPMSFLFGSGEVFDVATLAGLYPGGRAEYLERFGTALDQAIREGYLLPADRAEILALAAATYPNR